MTDRRELFLLVSSLSLLNFICHCMPYGITLQALQCAATAQLWEERHTSCGGRSLVTFSICSF